MAFLKIPIRQDLPAYNYRIDLDGESYNLRFRYNGRLDRWFMDILTANNTPIRYGIKLLTNVNLSAILKRPEYPDGDFLVINDLGEAINPTRENFANTVNLFYREADV